MSFLLLRIYVTDVPHNKIPICLEVVWSQRAWSAIVWRSGCKQGPTVTV